MLAFIIFSRITVSLLSFPMVPTCGGAPLDLSPIASEGQYFDELFCRDDFVARFALPQSILSHKLFHDRLLSDQDDKGRRFQRLPLLEAVKYNNIPAVILLLMCGNHANSVDPVYGWRPIDIAYKYAFSKDKPPLGTKYEWLLMFRLLLTAMGERVRDDMAEDDLLGTAIQLCKPDYQYEDIAGFVVNGIPCDGRQWNLSGRYWLAVHTEKRERGIHVSAWMLSDIRENPMRPLIDADFELLHGYWILVLGDTFVQSAYIHALLVCEQKQ